jgi:hypothetical protein
MSPRDLGLEQLRAAVAQAGARAATVSAWSVGMHVHHCCRATLGICKALAKSTPPSPRARFSPRVALMFLFGRIPRGRAEAPESARPADDVTPDELRALLDQAGEGIAAARALDPGAWFEHFALGVLARDRALRFVEIHHRHHLRIVAEILAAPETRGGHGAATS